MTAVLTGLLPQRYQNHGTPFEFNVPLTPLGHCTFIPGGGGVRKTTAYTPHCVAIVTMRPVYPLGGMVEVKEIRTCEWKD